MRKDVDKGWAWVVMATAFMATVITYGQFLSSGIYFVMFRNAFQESRGTTMWINAGQAAMYSVSALVSNALLIQFGTRCTAMVGAIALASSLAATSVAQTISHVVVCFSLAGAGHSLITSSIVAATAEYFEKRLYAVTGFVLSGVGVGMVVIGIEIQWCEKWYGWRGCMLIQSAISMQICLLAAVLFGTDRSKISRPSRNRALEKADSDVDDNDMPLKSLPRNFLSDKRFWTHMLAANVSLSCFYLTMQTVKDHVLLSNPDYPFDVIIYTIGVSLTVGRVSMGYLTTRFEPQILHMIAIFLNAISLTSLIATDFVWIPIVGAGVIGICTGVQFPASILTLSLLFGKEHVAIVFGYNNLFLGVLTFGVPLLAGYVVDRTETYWPVIGAAVVAMFISAALSWVTAQYITQSRAKVTEQQIELDSNEAEQKETFLKDRASKSPEVTVHNTNNH